MVGRWMLSLPWRKTVVVMLAHVMAAGSVKSGEPPTVAQLIEAAPVLTTADPQLQAMAARFEIRGPGTSMGGRVCWTRERQLGLVIWSGAAESPFLFVADDKTLLLDRSKMLAVMLTGFVWGVGIERRGDGFHYSLSGAYNSDTKIVVRCDLRSFVRSALDTLEMQRDVDGDWLLTGTLADGKGSWRAEFLDQPGYPMHSYESSFKGNRFALTDIAINERVNLVWPTMPSSAELPDSIRVSRLIWPRYGSLDRFCGQCWRIFKASCTVFALDNPQYRSRWIFGLADWNRIQQRDAELAPALRKLLVPGES